MEGDILKMARLMERMLENYLGTEPPTNISQQEAITNTYSSIPFAEETSDPYAESPNSSETNYNSRPFVDVDALRKQIWSASWVDELAAYFLRSIIQLCRAPNRPTLETILLVLADVYWMNR